MKPVAIYLRVSTSKQDTENQLRELCAVADRSGWEIWKVYEDAGISGAKGRDQRPGLEAMMKAVNAREFDMVAAWSVDRLSRSLTDLLGILQDLQEKGVDLFLHQQGLDTSTTAGKAMFQMLGVFAEFERGIIGNGHKKLTADWQGLYDQLQEAEFNAAKEHGHRPIELIHWRDYTIGASEIDIRRPCWKPVRSIRPRSSKNILTPTRAIKPR